MPERVPSDEAPKPEAASNLCSDDVSALREGEKDPVLNVKIHELIYHTSKFIVYLDERLRVQYRGDWLFPDGWEPICFELARLEALTLGERSFFWIKPDQEQLLAMRRLIAEVYARLHAAPSISNAQACLTKADQVISGIVADNTRLKRLVASVFVASLTGMIGWLWVIKHKGIPGTPGIHSDNEFGLWIPLGAIGALLFSFTRMHSIEVKPFSSNWLVFWESAARILAGAIGALLLVSAAKANLLLGVLSQATTNASAFWGLLTLSILAGASERLVPDFITRMDGSSSGTPPLKSPAPTKPTDP